MVIQNPKACMKNPAGVGTPAGVTMGTCFPKRLCTMRKVSGFAKIKNTSVLYRLYLSFRRNRFIENSETGFSSLGGAIYYWSLWEKCFVINIGSI